MADLIAQGARPGQRWRKKLTSSGPVILGRSAAWSVPWDSQISRQHAELNWSQGALAVRRLPEALNPLYFAGDACDTCRLQPGQHFVIGGTSFSLVEETVSVSNHSPVPTIEHTFSLDDVQRLNFRDAAQRIEVLSRLPEIIGGEISDEELCVRLVTLLLAGIPNATFAAVAKCDALGTSNAVEVLHWDQSPHGSPPIQPSDRLIRQTVRCGASTAHVWSPAVRGSPDPAQDSDRRSPSLAQRSSQANGSPAVDESCYTQTGAVTWALCTPLRYEANEGWCVYVAGRDRPVGISSDQDFASLQDDVKFTELIADAAGRLRELWRLQRQQAALAQFLSPMVLDRVGIDDPQQAFAPREAEISVLFCDLRGFSRESERSARDLMKLLERVSGALGVMTRHILTRGGVVGDFHGDAAMGFWGWPLDQPDRVQRASEAALAISADFARAAKHQDHPLAGFQIGIGIATGRAVAGKIGTAEQVKITVFGPVVNLAARLQDLTKTLRAPILVDEPTAEAIGELLSPGVARVRRVARLRPRGLDTPLTVSQLLPPEGDGPLTNEQIAIYERALTALNAGDFEQSYSLLHQVPADDRVKDFLTVFIAQHNRQPPAGWNGVIDWDGPVLRYSG